ncbi:MAG: ComF family protein [Actinobacteria bacterium HGW-Actinobacteria-6]|jgi:predicted amidophosphoribosyltransferase|nr:MAG: ComF family protein [Actinobacteria bacterium HGW-Actinobacteria-6]
MDVFGILAEILSPVRCAGCGLPGATLCPVCRSTAHLIQPGAGCQRCGAPLIGASCRECVDRSFAFSSAVCAGLLEPPLSRAVTLYKDAAERRYAVLLGALLSAACESWRGWPDAVCAVPPSERALARRGFDHTAALAGHVARELDVPHLRLLVAARRADQRGLGRDERRENMAGAFAVHPAVPVPSRVLVVDDVFTTGATLDGATRALLAAGALEVRVAAVARA